MFIHLGREKICLRSAQGSYKELPYLDIERKLPPLLHACIEERTPDMLWVLQ